MEVSDATDATWVILTDCSPSRPFRYFLQQYIYKVVRNYSMEHSPSWKLIVPNLVNKFPAFYGNRRFTTAFKRSRHLSISWARLIQSMRPSQFLKTHFNIILPSALRSFKWSLSLKVSHQTPLCRKIIKHKTKRLCCLFQIGSIFNVHKTTFKVYLTTAWYGLANWWWHMVPWCQTV